MGPVLRPLGLLLLLWRLPWTSKDATVVKKVDQMRLRNRPWHPEEPECYLRVPGTFKMKLMWSQKEGKVKKNMAPETLLVFEKTTLVAKENVVRRLLSQVAYKHVFSISCSYTLLELVFCRLCNELENSVTHPPINSD